MKTQHKVATEVPFLLNLGSSSRVWLRGVVFQPTVLARCSLVFSVCTKTVTQGTDLSVFTGKPVKPKRFGQKLPYTGLSDCEHCFFLQNHKQTTKQHEVWTFPDLLWKTTTTERFEAFELLYWSLNGGTYCRLVLSANSLLGQLVPSA